MPGNPEPTVRVLLKREHTTGCFLTPRATYAPWVIDRKNPVFMGDKLGGCRGQTTSWIRLRCNDPSCTALALVNEWDLSEIVDRKVADAR